MRQSHLRLEKRLRPGKVRDPALSDGRDYSAVLRTFASVNCAFIVEIEVG